MIMRWLAVLCIALAIESGMDARSMLGFAQRRQSSRRTTSKADLQARLSVAAQHREQGDYDRAAQEYLKPIQLAPRFAPAYNELGVCYLGIAYLGITAPVGSFTTPTDELVES
jgi:tetratricopeptide (TPR) repeat protein